MICLYALALIALIGILALVFAVVWVLERVWYKSYVVVKGLLYVITAYLSTLYMISGKDNLTFLAAAVLVMSCANIYEVVKEYRKL